VTSTWHSSPLPDLDIPDVALTEFVLRKAASYPNHAAMINGDTGETYTYAQLTEAIHQLAGGLQQQGFTKNSVLALIAPNSPEFAIVFHAVAVCGGTVTTVNPLYVADEIRHQLLDSGATLAVTIPACLESTNEATKGTSVTDVYTIGSIEGYTSLEELRGQPVEQVDIDIYSDVVVMPYSSGTTGLPKGVMLSHHNLVANLEQVNAATKNQHADIALAVLPFFHIYGMQVLMGAMLAEGATVVTMARFDMEKVLETIQKYKCTQFFAVPPIILGLAKHPVVDNYDLSSLKKIFSGAAPLGGEVANEAAQRLDCAVVQGYGMTEMSPVSHCTVGYDSRDGSCGVTVPNTVSRIVNEEGQDQGIDEVGELWVKGPQVMLGYLNNPTATAETLDAEGWLHTGDVARIDADGHMYIVDRVKELIKYKGFQVAPAELEALILTHPQIADAAVIGIPDDEAGEVPKAFVTLRESSHLTADELMAFISDRVTSYKQIRAVEFIDSIPKSASGKILRRQLRS